MLSSSSPPGARNRIGKTSLFSAVIAVLCLAALAISATGASAATTKWTTTPAMPLPMGATSAKAQAVACPSSACIAVGNSNNNGQPPLAEHWNGSAWSLKALPLPNDYQDEGLLNAISCSGGTCTAVGKYRDWTGKERPLAYRWSGTAWSLITLPQIPSTESSLNGVSCYSTRCVAVGTFRTGPLSYKQPWAVNYNGTSWTAEDLTALTGPYVSLNGVGCFSTTTCMAVGGTLTGTLKAVALQWTGGKWSVSKLVAPSEKENRLEGISCVATLPSGTGYCEAVGYYIPAAGGTTVPLAERWNGTEWTLQSTPNPAGGTKAALKGVSCVLSTCWASGAYTPSGASSSSPLGERFEASTWSVDLPNTIAGATSQNLSGISCFVSNKCMSVGTYYSGGVTLPMAQSLVRE